jgi:SAM-dependent methyltransferase
MSIVNTEQAEHWNSNESSHWVAHQERYDRMLEPFGHMVLDAAQISLGESVLDVGCGCGATTRATSPLVGSGAAVGLDLSVPMLARARADAESLGLTNTTFVEGDAQVYPFDEDRFDVLISRFGVMFFSDPVAAFANLKAATKPGGRLAFVCWQPLVENEWLLVPGAAISEHVPLPDLGPADAPGMFAFSEPEKVLADLTSAGWTDIEITPRRSELVLGGGGTVDDTVEFLRTGSMGRTLLDGVDEEIEMKAVDAVRRSLSNHASSEGVRLGAAVWVVSANA